MDLFEHSRQEQIKKQQPLAARMRPRTLDEFVGQDEIVGPGRLLRRAIEADQISSMIFWGPPGTGKTTLATVIANSTRSHFEIISAVLAGIAELRKVIEQARERRGMYGERTILLVDEIHRWNKAQQDALLPHVEDGTIILIGATTQNPFFEVIGALVSRSRIFEFKPLTDEAVLDLLRRALGDAERGLGTLPVIADLAALRHLADVAQGDARNALNALELAVVTTPVLRTATLKLQPDTFVVSDLLRQRRQAGQPLPEQIVHVTLEVAQESIQRRAVRYDKGGEEHYNTISAFIKSVRGSDPDAALYWLAKMVLAGEDPRFILRRLYILAAEDIGLADPQGIVVVNACAQAFEWVGMPEGQYHLSLATLYLATAPKSNSAGAYWSATAELEQHGAGPVPLYLRDKSENLGKGVRERYEESLKAAGYDTETGYKYPHSFPGGWVEQRYLPPRVAGDWFRPHGYGYEAELMERLHRWREGREEMGAGQPDAGPEEPPKP